MKLYPIKCQSVLYEKIWGGYRLAEMSHMKVHHLIGERWDIADQEKGTSLITNGQLKGKNLREAISLWQHQLLGESMTLDVSFPLLTKVLNISKGILSLQVHPSDEAAKKLGYDQGKDEVWYVAEASEGTCLITGFKNAHNLPLDQMDSQSLEEQLEYIPIEKGDVVYLPGGTVHSLKGDAVLIEYQQNTDLTFRIYDFGQARELHLNEAQKSIDPLLYSQPKKGLRVDKKEYQKRYLVVSKNLALEEFNLGQKKTFKSDPKRFHIVTNIGDSMEIAYDNGSIFLDYCESCVIPAGLGSYSVNGKSRFLRCYVPECDHLINEILKEVN